MKSQFKLSAEELSGVVTSYLQKKCRGVALANAQVTFEAGEAVIDADVVEKERKPRKPKAVGEDKSARKRA